MPKLPKKRSTLSRRTLLQRRAARTTTDTSTTDTSSTRMTRPAPTTKLEPAPTTKLEPTPMVRPEPEPAPTPMVRPEPEPAPSPKLDPIPSPKLDPIPSPKLDPAPSPKLDPRPLPGDLIDGPIKDGPIGGIGNIPYKGEIQWGELRQSRGTFIDRYAQLDATRPLALLPIRLETIYHPRGSHNPTELRIRIYPDDLHSDDLQRSLSEQERLDGEGFWCAWWRAGGAQARERAAWDGLVAAHGSRRAAWIARSSMPTDELSTWPTTPIPEHATLAKQPSFPPRTKSGRAQPGHSEVLPTRFCAVGFDSSGSQRFTQFGQPVPARLQTGLDLGELPQQPSSDAALTDPGSAWLVDYAQALAKGMAITIDLSQPQNSWAKAGVSQLLVFGVNDRLDPVADVPGKLGALLESQLYARGLELLEPGAPTNNTEQADSPWSREPADADAVLQREIRSALGQGDTAVDAEDAGSLLAEALGLPGVVGGDAGVIQRLANARRLDSKHARNMNLALWHTCLGFVLSVLCDGERKQLLDEPTIDWVRDWCADYVRGGGPLPAIGVGAQPYGVLPVMWQSTLSAWPTKLSIAQSRRYTLVDTLWRARAWWTRSVPFVPQVGIPPGTWRYDAIADVDGDGIDDSLLEILYRQPHPVRFNERKLREKKYTSPGWLFLFPSAYGLAGAHVWWQHWIHLLVEGVGDFRGWDATLGGQGLPTAGLTDELTAIRETAKLTNIDAQLSAWKSMRGALRSRASELSREADRHGRNTAKGAACAEVSSAMSAAYNVIDQPIRALETHDARLDVLRSLSTTGVGSVMNEDGPMLGYSVFDEDSSELGGPLVQATDPSNAAIAPRTWLRWLARRCTAPGASQIAQGTPPSLDGVESKPLLYTLLRAAILHVAVAQPGVERTSNVAANLGVIQAAITELERLDAAQLERLTAETLGINGYRYDAWVTSLARERLARLRNGHAQGATLGAYGWVLDLKPDTQRSDSLGFVHAPSLQQAVTASVLRSAWLSHAQDPTEQAAPLAVNLSSGRVRLAKWLLDGIRQGQALGDLLGYRLERQLHDAGLDRFIDDLRAAAQTVAGALGLPNPERTVADGLIIVEQRSHTAVQTVLGTAGSDRPKLEAIIDQLEAALDATADAVIAQGVHSALIGDDAGGTASFAALSADEAAPPSLEVVKTLRSATSLTHRLVVAWDPSKPSPGWAGAGSHPWSVVCPGLEGWVASLLGEPSRYQVRAIVEDIDSGQIVAQPWASLEGLSALELLRLTPLGEDEPPVELERRLAVQLAARLARHLTPGRRLRFDWDAPAAAPLPGAELLLLARCVRRLLTLSQPLSAADLVPAGVELDAPRSSMPAAITTAQRNLQQATASLRTALTREDGIDHAGVRTQLGKLARFAVPGAVPAWDASDAALEASARACLELAERRVAEAEAATDPDERMQAIMGMQLPVPLAIDQYDAGALAHSFTRGPARIAATTNAKVGADAVLEGWLQQVGKVHDGAGALAELLDLGEALADTRLTTLELAQLPDDPAEPAEPPEPWVGRAAPASGEAPRLSIIAWRDARLSWSAPRLAGLRVDAWNELVPHHRQVTGVGFHYDAPHARAPQSILLMVPPDTMSWSWDLVVETLRQTIELSKIRGVDNENLGALGHVLPATYR